jgi:uncharacterized membrane protein (UPF0127 family)
MISNRIRGTVLCENTEVAESSWKKARGLMFRKELREGQGLLMVFGEGSVPGIWMMGMRFPIDIVFIGSSMKVTRVVENARPLGLSWKTWRVYSSPASWVLELPSGRAGRTGTREGDFLEFSF